MSNERIDHAAEALSALEGAGDGRNFATDASLVALTHATLALVEQQKAANLIAWGVGSRIPDPESPEDLALTFVRTALGLEPRND